MRKRIVVLSGAGMSAESGLKTFRGAGGLWEGVPVQQVATPEAWLKDFKRVLRFYDERRKGMAEASPNAGHTALAELQNFHDVHIITQNIDDLHERAGSRHVLHLHGEISKARSTCDESLVYRLNSLEIKPGDLCEKGSQLRPHIVWFGEAVPLMEDAVSIVQLADILLIIGTSLEVYPAAGLIDFAPSGARIVLIDPFPPRTRGKVELIAEPASTGVAKFISELE